MIKSFRNKGLKTLHETGKSSKVRQDLKSRALKILDLLEQAQELEDFNWPGLRFHGLQGKPKRYSLTVNGPWRITFEFHNGNAEKVDLEQYH